jgi:hypothetical protein
MALSEPGDRNGLADAPADVGSDTGRGEVRGDGRDGDSSAGGDRPSAGGGLAVTSAAQPRLDAIAVSPSTQPADQGMIAGGGMGRSGSQAPGMAQGESDASHSAPAAPPWAASDWPAAQAAAGLSIRNNRIDPAYQDLVRDYFQRP